jgi:uncharacterized protein YjbI with pentapeptide repeats
MHETWPTCTVGDCVGIRLPGKRRCIAHAEAANRLLALEAITDGDPVDLRGVSLDERLLEQVVDALPSSVRGGKVWLRARLDGATIVRADAPLDLSGHEFVDAVSFRGVLAHRPVLMQNVSAERATFTGSAFAEQLDASGAVFRGPARFDDAEFPGGLALDGARFGESCDLRRTIAADVTLTGASIGTDIDFSLANFVRLDMRDARVARDVVFYAATVTDAAMTGISIGDQVFGVRARIAGWEPQPRRAVAGAQPSDWIAVPVQADPTTAAAGAGPAWRPELLPEPDAEQFRWVTVEEWVGSGAGASNGGGTIGLQVSPWPTADSAGRPQFDEDRTVVAAVDADALIGLLAERLGQHRMRIGSVYAMRLAPEYDPLPEDRTLSGELDDAVVGTPVDITSTAREAAHASAMATVMKPLDPQSDAALIGALANGSVQ